MSKFIEPWEAIEEPSRRKHFEAELQCEVTEGHQLADRAVKALARRVDRDDVLFELDGGPRVAVVHLTYATESSPVWPVTDMYESMAEFAEERMQPDNLEY